MQCFTLTETDDAIAHLVLSRPEAMNTMGPAFWRELDTVLTGLHRAGRARALVISSTGRHFSAGMDLAVFAGTPLIDDSRASGRAAVADLLAEMQATFTRLERLRMPVIAAIHGGCIGGAVDMVCAACIRYASADAFFCIQEINIGMAADVGTLQRLPKLIPEGVAREYAYTGRRMPAQRALEVGLVNAVFDSHAATVAAALDCAREIAQRAPLALWATKQAIQYARDHGTDDALQQMGWLQGVAWSNAQVHEAVAAQRERRAPQFEPLAPLASFHERG